MKKVTEAKDQIIGVIEKNRILTKFVKSYFQVVFEISLWILLIGFIIGGYIVASGILGSIIGFIAFTITIIPMYGLIAIFINIDKNIEIIKNNSILQEPSNET